MRHSGTMISGRSTRGLLVAIALAAAAAQAQQTIHHPDDGYPTIQAAVDAAGCGGTVLLAAGTYNERVFAPCSMRLIGAGAASTILDGTNLVEPVISQVVGFGAAPFTPADFTGDYELAGMTIRAGRDAPLIGVGIAWTQGAALHDLEIDGFSRGIAIAISTDGAIRDVKIHGPGSNPHRFTTARCIALFQFDLFLDQLPHMSGWTIDHNVLEDCAVGIDLQNNVGAIIASNTIRRTWIGLNLFGTDEAEVHHNLIAHSDEPVPYGLDATAMSLTNAIGSEIHHNTLCSNRAGIRYDGLEADAFGFPTSRYNRIHHNLFSQNGEDIGFNDPLLGPGNIEFANQSDPLFDCPP